MIVYYLMFLFSFICSYISSSSLKKELKVRYYIFKILAIIFPCLVAAFRTINVGTDTSFYALDNFILSLKTTDISEFIKTGYGEILYLIITFISANLFENIHFTFFIVQLIIQFFVYNACEKYSKTSFVPIAYLGFLLLFYNRSLNMMRQSISLAIVLYNFNNIKNEKLLKYMIFVIISSMFHITSFLTIIFYPLYMILKSDKNILKKVVIVSMLLFCVVGFEKIISILIYDIGVLSVKYSYYIQGGNSTVSTTFILFNTCFLVLFIIFNKPITQNDKFNNYLIFIYLLGSLVLLLGLKFNYVERLSYYFSYSLVLLLPHLIAVFKKGKDRLLMCIFVIVILFGFNFIYYGVQRNDGTSNYEFSIEKIF